MTSPATFIRAYTLKCFYSSLLPFENYHEKNIFHMSDAAKFYRFFFSSVYVHCFVVASRLVPLSTSSTPWHHPLSCSETVAHGVGAQNEAEPRTLWMEVTVFGWERGVDRCRAPRLPPLMSGAYSCHQWDGWAGLPGTDVCHPHFSQPYILSAEEKCLTGDQPNRKALPAHLAAEPRVCMAVDPFEGPNTFSIMRDFTTNCTRRVECPVSCRRVHWLIVSSVTSREVGTVCNTYLYLLFYLYRSVYFFLSQRQLQRKDEGTFTNIKPLLN